MEAAFQELHFLLLDGHEDGDPEVLGWAGVVCDKTRLRGRVSFSV